MHHAAFLAFFLFLYFSPFVSICCAIHLSIHSHTVHTISIEFELQCLMTCVASPGLSVPYKFSRHFCFEKFSRVFLRQPGEDGKSGGLVRGIGWRGCGGGQGINIGAEGAAARRVRRTAGVVKTSSASRHQTIVAVAASVEIFVKLLNSTLHVRWKIIWKIPLTVCGRVRTAEHWQLLEGSISACRSSLLYGSVRLSAQLIQRVDIVAAGSVGAETNTVVGAAHVGLVLGMAVNCSQLLLAVGKLALFAVLANTVFLERAAHLRLVPKLI